MKRIACNRCPWLVAKVHALDAVLAYEAHLVDEHAGLGPIGKLEVDHDRARAAAASWSSWANL